VSLAVTAVLREHNDACRYCNRLVRDFARALEALPAGQSEATWTVIDEQLLRLEGFARITTASLRAFFGRYDGEPSETRKTRCSCQRRWRHHIDYQHKTGYLDITLQPDPDRKVIP